MYVNLNSDKVKKGTISIKSDLASVLQGVTNVKNVVNNVSSIWSGEDYKQFSIKMNSFMDDLKKFEESLESCRAFVDGYIDAHEKLDTYYLNEEIKMK